MGAAKMLITQASSQWRRQALGLRQVQSLEQQSIDGNPHGAAGYRQRGDIRTQHQRVEHDGGEREINGMMK
ncbi:MAG: hypothetical protein ACI9OO_000078 [Bacteroidia bacterium]|jgi:hypothetical protein